MKFDQIKTKDYIVGMVETPASQKVFGESKKAKEDEGKRTLIDHIFPDGLALWEYEESGRPYFTNRGENLSFSHSENMYACQISDRIPCGIDIQHYKDKILRVPEKFLNARELRFIQQVADEHKVKTLTAMWSCKEALYKLYGKGFIDYVNQFTIHPFETCSGTVQATANMGQGASTYHLHVEFTDTFVLAFHTLSPLLPAND